MGFDDEGRDATERTSNVQNVERVLEQLTRNAPACHARVGPRARPAEFPRWKPDRRPIVPNHLQVDPKVYIYPPRAKAAIPFKDAAILAEFGYQAQLKYNDSRCLIKYLPGWKRDPGLIQLWNRHGERFRDYIAPLSLLEQLAQVPDLIGLQGDAHHLLDGGLLDKKHNAVKDTIVLWDVLVENGHHLLGTKYKDRYGRLQHAAQRGPQHNFLAGNNTLNVGNDLTADVFVPQTIQPQDWAAAWNNILKLNSHYPANSPLIEGLFYKLYDGKLEPGHVENNNADWQARSRVKTGRHRC